MFERTVGGVGLTGLCGWCRRVRRRFPQEPRSGCGNQDDSSYGGSVTKHLRAHARTLLYGGFASNPLAQSRWNRRHVGRGPLADDLDCIPEFAGLLGTRQAFGQVVPHGVSFIGPQSVQKVKFKPFLSLSTVHVSTPKTSCCLEYV